MNMNNKMIALALIVVLAVTAFGVTASSQQSDATTFTQDCFQYTVITEPGEGVNGTVSVKKAGTDIPAELVIPTDVTNEGNTYDVIKIDDYAFAGVNISSVQLPDKLQEIAKYAFRETGIQSITFPDSLVSIAVGAFKSNNFASLPTIADTVTLEGYVFEDNPITEATIQPSTANVEGMFCNMHNLTAVYVGEGVTMDKIPQSYFSNSEALTTFQIPDTVKSIEKTAFRGTGITTFNVPTSLETIGVNAFDGSALTTIPVISAQVSIGNYAFQGTKIESVTIQDNMKDVEGLFSGCEQLSSVTYAEGVQPTKIPNSYLRDTKSLTQFVIPQTVTEIGISAFQGSAISQINMPSTVVKIGNTAFKQSALSVVPDLKSITTFGNYVFEGSEVESVTLTQTMMTDGTFSACTNLSNVAFDSGATITQIPGSYFRGCSSLTTITLPSTVGTIGSYAFAGTGIEAIELPDSLTTIGNNAFTNSQLNVLPQLDHVTTLGTYAFEGTQLESVTITEVMKGVNGLFSNCAQLKSVSYADGVAPDTIPDAYFRGTALQSFTIPSSVTTIANSAFRECSISEITIPASVTTIGNTAFFGASLLTVVSEGTATVGTNAFAAQKYPTLEFQGWNPAIGANLEVTTYNATTLLKHTVTYVVDGSEDAPIQEPVTEGAQFTVADYKGVKEGYTFAGWNDGVSDYTAGTKYTMGTTDVTLTVIWNANNYTITIDEAIENGSVTADATAATIGTKVTLTNEPAEGYTLKSYTVKDSEGSEVAVSSGAFTMPASDVTVSATFELKSFKISIASDIVGGTVEASATTAKIGEVISLTNVPDEKYRFVSYTVTASEQTVEVVDGQFTMPDSAVVVSATFEEVPAAYVVAEPSGEYEFATIEEALASEAVYIYVMIDVENVDVAITAEDLDKAIILDSGKTISATFNVEDEGVVSEIRFENVKAAGPMMIAFGSVHITGALVEGNVVVVSGDAVVDGIATIGEGMKLIVEDGATLTVSAGSTLIIDAGAIVENDGTITVETGTTDGEIIVYNNADIPDAQKMVTVYNAAPAYVEIWDSTDPDSHNVIPNGEDVVAGTTIYVHYTQALPDTIAVHYKTFWQATPTDVEASDAPVTVDESVWVYADYPNYNGVLANGKIWEGNNATEYFTVTHQYSVNEVYSVITVPVADGAFAGTHPHYTYRIIHLTEDIQQEQYVAVTDTISVAVDEIITLNVDKLEPGMYYLTMITDDGQFGFVNYRFLVKEPDYRIGLTWDSAATAANYSAWVADINGGYVLPGDIVVDGYEIKEGTLADGSSPYNYIVYYEGVFTGLIENDDLTDKYNRPIGIADLALTNTDVTDVKKLTALLPYYILNMGTADEVRYAGNESYGVYEEAEDDIKGTYMSTGKVKTLNFDSTSEHFMELEEKQAFSLIRATSDALPAGDPTTYHVKVYYLSAADDGISAVLSDVEFDFDLTDRQYYNTLIFGIDQIRNGCTIGTQEIAEHPDAKWVLMYEVTESGNQDALNIYENLTI